MMAKIVKFFMHTTCMFLLLFFCNQGIAAAATHIEPKDPISRVICNVVIFIQKLGLPIMTGVIMGSSIMAIFGRLAWHTIATLVVFTAIFFGAGKIISKIASGIGGLNAEKFDCKPGKAKKQEIWII
ncbi:TrbC/VirB2 family protein [Anaplasma phagocytophilum]